MAQSSLEASECCQFDITVSQEDEDEEDTQDQLASAMDPISMTFKPTMA